jgi:hypothetical protein
MTGRVGRYVAPCLVDCGRITALTRGASGTSFEASDGSVAGAENTAGEGVLVGADTLDADESVSETMPETD